MERRFLVIWFRYLTTDWLTRQQPELKDVSFVFAAPDRGRMVVKEASITAERNDIRKGMVVADCRAILPSLQVFDEKPGKAEELLNALAEWFLRYTPLIALDTPEGLILDINGCPHLWGGEQSYLRDILTRLKEYGYHTRAAIADTIGAAWALSRYGKAISIVESGRQEESLRLLPPVALRINIDIAERLNKLGFYDIGSFMSMPSGILRRRFGSELLLRLGQALGREIEALSYIQPPQPFQERLPALEPIRTATGIEIAIRRLLETLCDRLAKEEKGLRTATFKCFRVDGNIQEIGIGTNKPSRNAAHLFRLFELNIPFIEPDLGIELFVLEAPIVEDLLPEQEALWDINGNHDEAVIAELVDKISGKLGGHVIHRYLPVEHYWPERSARLAGSLQESPQTSWRTDRPRPLHLLPEPERVEVTVAIPDYPPMHFIYQEKLHRIAKADGPERIEREWWLESGEHRDYYVLEDEEGARYWLFRSGHYNSGEPQWFLHGFFA